MFLLAALLAQGAAACGEQEPRASEPVTVESEAFGVNGHVLRAISAAGRTRDLDAQLTSIEELDLSFVRANADWSRLEPQPSAGRTHHYDFTGLDAWVEALARHRLRWYAIGIGASIPEWAAAPAARAAGCGGKAPPAEASSLASLLAVIAERYGRNGAFWREHPELPQLPVLDYEVWNEENHGAFWCPAPDPVAYAGFYLEARDAVREHDPRARVVFGGLAPFHETTPAGPGKAAQMSAEQFVGEAVASRPELAEAIDVVGVHTYGDPETVTADLGWYRGILNANGIEAPISLNEVGWPTAGESAGVVDEETRSSYLAEAAGNAIRSDCGVVSVAAHTWVTEETDPADPEHWFGIADPGGGEPYPSARAYAAEAREATRQRRFLPSAVEPLCAETGT